MKTKEPLHDWDGTIIPQIAGDAATYRKALRELGPEDLSEIGKRIGKSRVDIATARPALFHPAIRAAGKRMGLNIGDIHAAGFDKTETVRRLNRPLLDNNADVVTKVQEALGSHMATLVPTHTKAASSWLGRWLSMFAARDAAHQADPTRDSLATKLLGGPASLGLSEAINNHAIMGATPAERRESMQSAVDDVKDESYGDAFLRGLKSSPSYVLAGAGMGAATPALTSALKKEPISGTKSLQGAGVGAASGLALSVLRPLLQRAILGNTSRKSQRQAIAVKAENPVLTALPFGDMIGAAKSATREKLIGGAADGVPDSAFPAKALAKGKQHEAEHTDDPGIQAEVAKDHLIEHPTYYKKLEKLEQE